MAIILKAKASTRTRAFEVILNKIVRGEYPPGTLLSEQSLSVELDIGRTPIRESLQLLAYEGFVEVLPKRGTFVRGFDSEDFGEIVDFRIELEALAARRAAMHRTEADILDLQDFIHRIRTLSMADTFDPISVDLTFHTLVVSAAHNEYLKVQAIRFYRLSLRNFLLVNHSILKREVIEARDEQADIVEAIRNGDAEQAEMLMRHHNDVYLRQVNPGNIATLIRQ